MSLTREAQQALALVKRHGNVEHSSKGIEHRQRTAEQNRSPKGCECLRNSLWLIIAEIEGHAALEGAFLGNWNRASDG